MSKCAECARERFCPNYDSRMLYGFCHRFVRGNKEMHEQAGTGKRRRIIVNGKRIYVIVTRVNDGRATAHWSMPHENRKQLGGRRISPHEAGVIKETILKLLREV